MSFEMRMRTHTTQFACTTCISKSLYDFVVNLLYRVSRTYFTFLNGLKMTVIHIQCEETR